MPKPVIEGEDVADTVRQAVFLMRVGHPDIDIEVDIKQEPMHAKFDRRLISQGLTNIIKNATEAIGAVPPAKSGEGRIDVIAVRENDDIVIDVIDNGIGLPKESRVAVAGALCDDPRERHRPWPRDRRPGSGRSWRPHRTQRRIRIAPGARGAWMRLRFAVPAPMRRRRKRRRRTRVRRLTETKSPQPAIDRDRA